MVLRRYKPLSSAEKRFCTKLAPKFEDPGKITKVLSDVDYEIDNPNNRRIPQAHVSDMYPFNQPQRPIDVISPPNPPDTPETIVNKPEASPKRKRGRPPGSKNKTIAPTSLENSGPGNYKLRPRKEK